LSGFVLYQAAYAELFFVDTLWPDFTLVELDHSMAAFARWERRFGR
jgi:undecaprenyl diphosphate synthase